jgi:hypothetical protein
MVREIRLFRVIRVPKGGCYIQHKTAPKVAGTKKAARRRPFSNFAEIIAFSPPFSSSVQAPSARRSTRNAGIRYRWKSAHRSSRTLPGWAVVKRHARGGGPSGRRSVFVSDVVAFHELLIVSPEHVREGKRLPGKAGIISLLSSRVKQPDLP